MDVFEPVQRRCAVFNDRMFVKEAWHVLVRFSLAFTVSEVVIVSRAESPDYEVVVSKHHTELTPERLANQGLSMDTVHVSIFFSHFDSMI